MAALRFKDEHNKVGYLLKPTRSDDYHQIINFLRASHIRSPELGPPAIQATIDKTPYTSTKDLVRSRLQLADDGGITDLPIATIYFGMDNLGTKSGSWDQFGSPIAVALICLSDGRCFNWSSYIFKRMHGQSSDLNTASFSRSHERAAGPFTNMEDKPLGGSFNMSPPSSTQAPPAGQPSGSAKEPITLTVLSYVVSTLVQKDHKKIFKDVVGTLVKKVKAMEVKLKTKKRKMVVSDSDQEEGGQQDVDLDALLLLANAAVTVDSNISPGGASNNPGALTVPPSTSAVLLDASTVPPGTSAVPPGTFTVPTGASTAPAEEDIPVKARTFKHMEEDRLGEEAAKRLHDEEQAQLDRQRAELQRQRQQEVLDLAMYYIEAVWINIRAQVEANASLSKTLLGDDVSKDNFPARMAALIKRKRQALAEKLVKERQNRPMTQAQQRGYMRQYSLNKIRKVQSNSQIQTFSRTLKRTGPMLEEPTSKRQKSNEAPIPSVHVVTQSLAISSPLSSGTRKKSLGRKRLTKPKSTLQELDLDVDAQTFIKVVSTKDSDDEAPPVWSALVGWEVIFTPLGDINAFIE
nr:hypothetical protein [Tanacetum cinerariifolium]